jgi:hypothetical protein
MSDGDSEYPEDSINKIKMSPVYGMLNFKAIANGYKSACLDKMAQELGCTSDSILEPN